MENNEYSSGDNWNQGSNFNQNQMVTDLPNAKGSFILGIISLCVSVVCCLCYGYIVGVILSVIGLFLGISATRRYDENPGAYTEKSYRKAKTGKMLNIIGLIISVLMTIGIVIIAVMGLQGNLPPEMQDAFDDQMRKYNR